MPIGTTWPTWLSHETLNLPQSSIFWSEVFVAATRRELKQPRRRRQQERHKFAYLTKKNNSFARFARAFFIFLHFADVLVLSMTWNDMFCSCVDDVSIWWETFNFAFLPLKRLFQFNSRIIRTHFARLMTLKNCEIFAETRSYIFRWRSQSRRRRLCLSSLYCRLVNWLLLKLPNGEVKHEGSMVSNEFQTVDYHDERFPIVIHTDEGITLKTKRLLIQHHIFHLVSVCDLPFWKSCN